MGGFVSGVHVLEALRTGKIKPEDLAADTPKDPPSQGLYQTSKFAVVGLSEALASDLAAQGVGVSVLCPGLVQSDLVNKSFSLLTGSGADPDAPASDVDSGIPARGVGDMVIDAVRENRFYILTHDDHLELLESRHSNIENNMKDHAKRYGSTSGRTV